MLRADPVGRGYEELVLHGGREVCALAVGKHQVGRVGDDVGAHGRQRPEALGEKPIETDGHADPRAPEVKDLEARVAGGKEKIFLIEEVGLPVKPLASVREEGQGRVVEPVAGQLGKAEDYAGVETPRRVAEGLDGGGTQAFGLAPRLLDRSELVAGIGQLWKDIEVGRGRLHGRDEAGGVSRLVAEDGMVLD